MAALAVPGFASRAFAKPADPVTFVGWQYNPQIVEENVGIFSKLYDENVKYELVPHPYHVVVETKKLGGQHIDVMYSEESHIVRWNRAGWTRDLESLPGLDTIKNLSLNNINFPVSYDSCSQLKQCEISLIIFFESDHYLAKPVEP